MNIKPYPHVYRVNGAEGYGVKTYIGATQYGESKAHTDTTKANPEMVETVLDKMEAKLRDALRPISLA